MFSSSIILVLIIKRYLKPFNTLFSLRTNIKPVGITRTYLTLQYYRRNTTSLLTRFQPYRANFSHFKSVYTQESDYSKRLRRRFRAILIMGDRTLHGKQEYT